MCNLAILMSCLSNLRWWMNKFAFYHINNQACHVYDYVLYLTLFYLFDSLKCLFKIYQPGIPSCYNTQTFGRENTSNFPFGQNILKAVTKIHTVFYI